MIVKSPPNMVAEAEILCHQSVSVHYLCVDKELNFLDVSASPVSIESVVSCSPRIQATAVDTARSASFVPSIRSGSHTDIGPRRSNEDEHIRIDDLSACLGSRYLWPVPSAFYAVFDGHGGSDAAVYLKNNALRFFFEDAGLPQTTVIDEAFLEELESCHCRAFLLADRTLADEGTIDVSCGSTAITALVLGRHLLIANAGDCRAVLCRKGVAVQMSQDHRPTCLLEQKRVKDLGGFIEYGYLNGELAVTRALGDWYMKLGSAASASPLTAEPEVQKILLTEDDEFLIIGCDGIWDVMSNQEAVSIVRHELRLHNNPQECARELVNQALCRDTSDNLTAIVVCFTSADRQDKLPSQRPRLKFCSLSEEARKKLRSLLDGN